MSASLECVDLVTNVVENDGDFCDISFLFSFVATCLFVVVGCGGRESTGMGRGIVKTKTRLVCVAVLSCVCDNELFPSTYYVLQ